MEILIVAVIFYLAGRDAEVIQGYRGSTVRLKRLANIASGILGFIFVLGLLKYGFAGLLAQSLENDEFYALLGLLCIWLGYITRIKRMPDLAKSKNYYAVYRNFNYRQSIPVSLGIGLCDAIGVVCLLLGFKF